MNRTRLALALCLTALAPMAWAAGLCDRLDAFEHAAFPPDHGEPRRHWVELHWVGVWLDQEDPERIVCKHSADSAATELCSWLLTDAFFEFPDAMPRAILICHGYRFPQGSGWSAWTASIDLPNRAQQNVLLQIDMAAHKTPDAAVRLSVFPRDDGHGSGDDEATEPLPPLFENSDLPPDGDDGLH